MLNTPSQVLIEDTIARLEALAEVLRSERDGHSSSSDGLTDVERRRKEVGLSIRVLLPKLKLMQVADVSTSLAPGRLCLHCED